MSYQVPSFPGVHLPGSVPLKDADEVFNWANDSLVPWIHRCPDGETGDRWFWVQSQEAFFIENPALELVENPKNLGPMQKKFRVRKGMTPTFPGFRYPDWAKESYALFSNKRDTGELPQEMRFVVTFPHPMDAVRIYSVPEAFQQIYPAYEAQAKASLDEVLAEIPHEDLCIQWDIPSATNVYCGSDRELAFNDPMEILEAILRAVHWVPGSVELGFHLCFGDAEAGKDKRAKIPADATDLVRLVNDIVAGAQRPIQYFHLPTWISWTEPEQFAPLKNLALDSATELSVGVINLRRDADQTLEEAAERARRRASAVRATIGPAGVATSCGMGRHTPQQFELATELYRELSAEIAD
ncbi:MAG: hypothetical protein OXC05_13195 [Halieaceae bacterium]|nr:hypothetical protein [Halieaceae bacterium]